MYSAALEAQTVGASITIMPTATRMPRSAATSATTSGEKVHVLEAGRAATDHFANGEFRAVPDELGRCPASLRRPDVLAEPFAEGHIVGKAAKQRHGGMRMGVDEPGHQHVLWPLDDAAGGKRSLDLRPWGQGDDAAIADHERMIGQHGAAGFDRDDPAGVDNEIDLFHRGGLVRAFPGPVDNA